MKLSASNLGWAAEQDEAMYGLLSRLGYTGLEIAPTRLFGERPYEQLLRAAAFAKDLQSRYGLTVPSMQSIWFGQSGSIFDPDDAARLGGYTEQAFAFARAVGCGSLVFGNPRQRRCPPGCAPEQAEPFFEKLGRCAAERGVRLALEPNPPLYDTNLLNTTRQAAALVKKLALPGLAVNLDVGTMLANGETVQDAAEALPFVSHVHISEPGLVPVVPHALHGQLAALLRQSGYEGFVSVEMKAANPETVQACLQYVAEVFA